MPSGPLTQSFVPWPWRRRPTSLPLDQQEWSDRAQPGWIDIHLVRVSRRRLGAKSRLYPPATLTTPVSFMPLPPRVTLQAVNRSSTF